MAETRYQDLSADDRRDALQVAERGSNHKAHLLEKDIWVVATLRVLFDAPFAEHLIFKGGTSLSKVWRASRGPSTRCSSSSPTGRNTRSSVTNSPPVDLAGLPLALSKIRDGPGLLIGRAHQPAGC